MTYPTLYGGTYGSGFPQSPLPAKVELQLGTWTDITSYVLQRDGTQPAIQCQRGRPDETTTANPAQASMQWNNRDSRFTIRNPAGPYYGLLGRNTPVRISVPAPATYLRIEDDSTSFARTTPVLTPGTGNQDIRLDLALSGYSACTLASWWGSGQRAWLLLLNGDGTVALSTSTDGTLATRQVATSTMPLPLGPVTLRVALDQASGNAIFFTAPAGGIVTGPWTQLGLVVPTMSPGRTLFASSAVVSVGYNGTAVTDFLASQGLTGAVSDFMLLASGPPVSVIAQAGFSSQPAGTTSWTGPDGNAWTASGSAQVDGASYRFHGEMSSLPTAWDPSGADVWAPVTAGGILRRIQAGNTPVPSAFRRYEQQDIVSAATWPMEDGPLATQFASGLSGGLPMQILSGAPRFSADSSFICAAPLVTMNGAVWAGPVQNFTDTGTIVVRFLANPDTALSGLCPFIRFDFTGTYITQCYVAYLPGSGWKMMSVVGADLSGFVNVTGPVLVSAEFTTSGGTITPTLRVMDTSGNITASSTVTASADIGRVLGCTVNPYQDNQAGFNSARNSVIGHLLVQSAFNQLQGTPQNVIAAWAGEAAGNRFARLCAENSIQARIYGYPSVTAVMGAQPQGTLTQLLQECETADMGTIYEPRTCLGLGYRTLASLCDQSPKVVLDYAQAHIGQQGQPGEWQPVDDDQQTRNDVTVTRQSAAGGSTKGAAYNAALNDGSPMSISPPPEGAGDYDTQVTANVAADSQLPDVAGWLLHIGTVDEERYPVIPLNLARPALGGLYQAVTSVDLGDYVQVVNPPPWVPPGPVKQLAFGITERLGGFWYMIDWQAVPESPYETGLLDDPVLGRANTDGSALHAGITSGATSMQVDTVNAAFPLWTTSAADFPFDIMMGGERITVTNITGTSTPQTFTVTRSVNGVVKAHSTGEDVRLAQPSYLAVT